LEGELALRVSRPGEVERIVSRNASIKESESILARLNVQERPRLAIDVDDVAPGACLLLELRLKRTVLVVVLGTENERNVELAIARGETQHVLGWISQDVSARLTEIRVLSSLKPVSSVLTNQQFGSVAHNPQRVVMIP
jgi:hypothetical protein